jgi:hypothetical protein
VIVLDTTILVYSVGGDHPLREPCRALIAAVGEGRVAATTTVEVVQEFAHVWSRRRDRAATRAIANDFVDLLSPLALPDVDELRHGLDLHVAHPGLGAFDAVLAATVIDREHLTALASADRSFARVPGLRHLDPADPAMIESLSGR